MTRSPVIFAVVSALAVGACGKVGALDQPAPLVGSKAKADYESKKNADAQAAQAKKGADQIERLPTEKPYDPNIDTTTSRTLPVTGQLSTPQGTPQQGLLPDPVNPAPH